MKKRWYVFAFLLFGCTSAPKDTDKKVTPTPEINEKAPVNKDKEDKQETMEISVEANGNTITYELNDSSAAKAFYAQLPLSIEVENFGDKEKITYPPKKLNTANDTPIANSYVGTFAYYKPWGNIVMFYKDYVSGSNTGNDLYALGDVTNGKDLIEDISGTITISAIK